MAGRTAFASSRHNQLTYVAEFSPPDGGNVLRDAPPDHPHHHGLMYAVKVNGLSFWEEISGSNFPRFDLNPNSGQPFGTDTELHTARQGVFHDRARPSHLLLPIIPQK